MANQTPIGIDLGTTNSAVAWIDASGQSAMVTNAEGDLLTPSVVLFDEAEVVVGKDARSATAAVPDRVAELVKRYMGEPVYGRSIHGEYLPPAVIQACILRKLKADAFKSLGHEARAVITVPAYFDDPRRQATVDAGEMAGLNVLDIVNEPTAAALAFGEVLGYLSPTGTPRQEMTVLVYDLGGGTFDVTLLRLASGDIRMLATDGDVQLGGHDWDHRMVDHLAEAFKQMHGIDPRDDPAALARLYNVVIETKHTLSARSRMNVRVDHAGKAMELKFTRQQFEEMTGDLLERTAYTTRQVVAAAGLAWTNISRVLLVGGSSRMPMVARMLQEVTGIVPDRTVNPDEAVARGAAIYARYLLHKQTPSGPEPSFQVTDVNAHSLGVEGIEPATMRKANFVLIPRNTQLPARFTERFITKSEGQQSIVIQILQGESSLPGECAAIGRTVIRGLPLGLPKGWPVEVTFEYGTNGRLNVRAAVQGTHREVRLELERDSRLSGEGMGQWRQAVSAAAGFGAFQTAAQQQAGQPIPFQQTTQPQAAAQTGAAQPPPATGGHQGGPPPIPQAKAAPAEPVNGQAAAASRNRTRRLVVMVIGYTSSAVAGLTVGYLVLHFLKPGAFSLPW